MKIGNLEVFGVIYKITNKVNGKVYIGQTHQKNGFADRYKGGTGKGIKRVFTHYQSCKRRGDNYNKHLYKAIRKYGIRAFEVCEVFDVAFSLDELNIKEMSWISIYKANNLEYGYNKTEGGEGTKGRKDNRTKKQKKESAKKAQKTKSYNEYLYREEPAEYYSLKPEKIQENYDKIYEIYERSCYRRFRMYIEDIRVTAEEMLKRNDLSEKEKQTLFEMEEFLYWYERNTSIIKKNYPDTIDKAIDFICSEEESRSPFYIGKELTEEDHNYIRSYVIDTCYDSLKDFFIK